jgi:hypothetical protein
MNEKEEGKFFCNDCGERTEGISFGDPDINVCSHCYSDRITPVSLIKWCKLCGDLPTVKAFGICWVCKAKIVNECLEKLRGYLYGFSDREICSEHMGEKTPCIFCALREELIKQGFLKETAQMLANEEYWIEDDKKFMDREIKRIRNEIDTQPRNLRK